jgi:hypothetical protein
MRRREEYVVSALRRVDPLSSPPGSVSWPRVRATIEKILGRSLVWYDAGSEKADPSVEEWLLSVPALLKWIQSDRCLRSPRAWPKEVLSSFAHRLIPTPYEIANVCFDRKLMLENEEYEAFLVVVLYMLGFRIQDLIELRNWGSREVLWHMSVGIRAVTREPRFVLWASATDFSRAMLPLSTRDLRPLERLELSDALDQNPFRLSFEEASSLLATPKYLTYLIYGAPKKPRLTYTNRFFLTREASDGEVTQDEDQSAARVCRG